MIHPSVTFEIPAIVQQLGNLFGLPLMTHVHVLLRHLLAVAANGRAIPQPWVALGLGLTQGHVLQVVLELAGRAVLLLHDLSAVFEFLDGRFGLFVECAHQLGVNFRDFVCGLVCGVFDFLFEVAF